MNTPYQGTRPHAEIAVKGTQADVDSVVKNKSLSKLDNLLYSADNHAQAGRSAHANTTLEAALPLLHEVLAIGDTGKMAFAETCKRCNVALPPIIQSEPDPDNELLKDLMNKIDPVMQEGERPIDTLDRIIAGFVQTVAPATEETADEDQGKRKGKK